jgi:hypothetical protein
LGRLVNVTVLTLSARLGDRQLENERAHKRELMILFGENASGGKSIQGDFFAD